MSSEHRDGVAIPLNEHEMSPPSPNAPVGKLGQAAFELYATSGEVVSFAAEFEVSDDTPLGDMRAWLRADAERIARGKIPEAYYKAGSNMNRIHQGFKVADPHNPLPDHAPTRLLANYIRYRKTCGDIDPSEMTHGFLVELYEAYLTDAKTFFEHGVNKAEDVALYHGRAILADLRAAYENHPFIGLGDINKSFSFNRKNPVSYLERLETTVSSFKATIEPALRAEYGYPGSWSQQFVKNLCESTDPESLARRTFATMQEIQAAYPRANPKSVERWARDSVIDQGRKRASVKELLKDIPNITVSEQQLLHAASDLDKLRKALLSGDIRPMSNVKSPAVQRLLRIADANWDQSFDEIDISREVKRIYFAVRDYNTSLEGQEADHPIGVEPEHLYALLVKFAGDVAMLKEEGPPWAAPDVARFHKPGIYTFYRKKYGDVLPAGLIDETISHRPMTVDAHIEQQAANTYES